MCHAIAAAPTGAGHALPEDVAQDGAGDASEHEFSEREFEDSHPLQRSGLGEDSSGHQVFYLPTLYALLYSANIYLDAGESTSNRPQAALL